MTRGLLSFLVLAALTTPGFAGERRFSDEREFGKPCPEHGPGFVRLPGTSTCLRVGGRVRAEYGTTTGGRIARDQIAGFGSSGFLSADARTDTAAGPVRTFVRMRAASGAR